VTTPGRIVQVNVSSGGVPKIAVESAVVTPLGLEGDDHRDRRHHGGPDRAVCLYSMEAIQALQTEGHTVVPGALGENVTVEGVDWSTVAPGRRLRLGEAVVVEITRFTTPCLNITASFVDGDYSRVSEKRHPGWSRVYARVLEPGVLRRGDFVRVLDSTPRAPVAP
jgi:MOSC domain-containing protein YiiM